jgi:DNA-binding transcriptional LysR family regulator
MELRVMRYFQAVAEERHFGRAAERLHMAQPPLSRQIKALEEELGATLFVRTAKGVDLTEAGQALLDEVGNILGLAQRAKERAQLAGQGRVGRLDVGLFGSSVLDTIPRILSQFHAEYPDVRIVLHNLTKAEQFQALHERRIAIGFNRLVPAEPGIRVERVLREALVVALHESHPLARRRRIRLAELDAVPLVTYPNLPLRGLAQEIADAFNREGLRFNPVQEVEDVLTAVALVAGNFGVAITTQPATNLRLPGVAFRPLQCAHLDSIELSCLYRQDDSSPTLAAFLQVLRAGDWKARPESGGKSRNLDFAPRPRRAASPVLPRSRRRVP